MTIDISQYRVHSDQRVHLADIDPNHVPENRDEVEAQFHDDLKQLVELQKRLRAEEKHAVLVVLLAVDTGGKDPTIRDVFGELDLRGARVAKFGKPSEKEEQHDFLWRAHTDIPGHGEIVIFNRSYYDDVVEPYLQGEIDRPTVECRLGHIRNFESLLVDSGVTIVKFHFRISQEEQTRRILRRIEDPSEQHEFDPHDIEVNERWDEYQTIFEDVINATATNEASWHIVPADQDWFRNAVVARVVAEALERIDPQFPAPVENIEQYKERLQTD